MNNFWGVLCVIAPWIRQMPSGTTHWGFEMACPPWNRQNAVMNNFFPKKLRCRQEQQLFLTCVISSLSPSSGYALFLSFGASLSPSFGIRPSYLSSVLSQSFVYALSLSSVYALPVSILCIRPSCLHPLEYTLPVSILCACPSCLYPLYRIRPSSFPSSGIRPSCLYILGCGWKQEGRILPFIFGFWFL